MYYEYIFMTIGFSIILDINNKPTYFFISYLIKTQKNMKYAFYYFSKY